MGVQITTIRISSMIST